MSEFYKIVSVDQKGSAIEVYTTEKHLRINASMMSSEYGNVETTPVEREDVPADVLEDLEQQQK